MFKIGEFAKLTQVSIRMLRYYDENDLLKPAYIDPNTGYRMYSTEQISRLQQIVMLRDCRFTVAEIKKLLHEWQETTLEEVLTAKRTEIEKTILAEKERLEKINTALEDLKEQQVEFQYQIQFKSIPSYTVISLRKKAADYYEERRLWEELCAYVKEHKIEVLSGPYNNLSIYYEEENQKDCVDIETAMVIPKVIEVERPFQSYQTQAYEQAAYMMVYGPYSRIAKAYEQMAYWLNDHDQYEIYGCCRQVSHIGPGEAETPAEYLTEIQIPVRKR